jgi:zinc protease
MRRILPVILLLAASTAFAQEEIRLEVPYERIVLPNGLNVILHEDHTTPTVSVNVYYHVGSGREKYGRTGFAHLFEHIMFEGSGHVPEGAFDNWLEAAGGSNNGSTNPDRTNYWEDVPSNALELALFLESDRMGYLLDAMSPEKVDGQRDVVKNERRQSYENRPYGLASEMIRANLYPPEHPYHWTTIGSMDDLSAASFEDVVEFFSTWYSPSNASLSIAGDIDIEETKALVEKWFSDVPAGPPVPPADATVAFLTEEKRLVLEDRVSLPRLYMAWLSPAYYSSGDPELDVLGDILAGGKTSRLYQRLVYEMQIAQNVFAFQSSGELGSQFQIVATARAGVDLDEIERVIVEEIDRLKMEAPDQREVERVVNQIEASRLDGLERVGGFGGKADRLNAFYTYTGNPDYFNEELQRYNALDPSDIQAAAQTWLTNGRVVLSVVPQGETELASEGAKPKTD